MTASRPLAYQVPSVTVITDAVSSTAAALSVVAFTATAPMMSLHRLDAILAAPLCQQLDPKSRPSLVDNPSQGTLGGGSPALARVGKSILAPFWRLSWWWLLGKEALVFALFVVLGMAETMDEDYWRLGCIFKVGDRGVKTFLQKQPTQS